MVQTRDTGSHLTCMTRKISRNLNQVNRGTEAVTVPQAGERYNRAPCKSNEQDPDKGAHSSKFGETAGYGSSRLAQMRKNQEED